MVSRHIDERIYPELDSSYTYKEVYMERLIDGWEEPIEAINGLKKYLESEPENITLTRDEQFELMRDYANEYFEYQKNIGD